MSSPQLHLTVVPQDPKLVKKGFAWLKEAMTFKRKPVEHGEVRTAQVLSYHSQLQPLATNQDRYKAVFQDSLSHLVKDFYFSYSYDVRVLVTATQNPTTFGTNR